MRPLLVEAEPPRAAQTARPSASAAYRTSNEDGPTQPPGVATIREMFDRSVALHGGRPMLGVREGPARQPGKYAFSTYAEVGARVGAFAASLRRSASPGRSVGIFGQNCPDWMVAFLACARAGLVAVPISDTLGSREAEFVLGHSEAGVLVVSSSNLGKALDLASRVKGIGTVVHWSEPASAAYPLPPATSQATSAGVEVLGFEAFVRQGKGVAGDGRDAHPAPDDVLVIMYTSGTTGEQKGVMLTHRAMVNNMEAVRHHMLVGGIASGPHDSLLSYLPLAHILELELELFCVHVGAAVGYWRNDPAGLLDDAQALRPTVFLGVPFIFDRIVARFKSRVAGLGFLRRGAFGLGYRCKLALMKKNRRGGVLLGSLNALLFRKTCKLMGGRTKFILSAGAPLSFSTEEFLRVALCCPILQGYGLTETCGGCFVALPHRFEMFGTVGIPMHSTMFRLESVPELGYDALANPPCGELIIKSAHLFVGYHKDRESSNMDKDGWFHTGDIAQLENGCVRIMDRKHNVVVNSNGVFLALEKIEAVYRNCDVVDQIWIYCPRMGSQSSKQALVAVVVPHTKSIEAWAKRMKAVGRFPRLCATPGAKSYVLGQLQATAKAEGLNDDETVQRVFLDHEKFTTANGLLTATFKPRRVQLKNKYQRQIDEMLAQMV
eukprot:evm.model.scf_78.10 EVM.evm.TU.scf_78.10   scf_78:139341-142153(-)